MVATSKVLSSIEREARAFTTDLREYASRLLASNPEAGLKIFQAPDRILLQAGNLGVTVSIFRSRAGEEAGAEVLLSVWEGKVVFPGTTAHAGQRAKELQNQCFQIVPASDTAWNWQDGDPASALTSRALAAVCVEVMETRMLAALE